MTDKPLVAIHNLVYNHEPYLRECFEGFVMQKTNFRFVVISHDDCSTDDSAAIIREYAEKYPDIFRPIYETENQYSKRDGSLTRIMDEAIAATGAKYVAMCEGDDYWTDPLKLQKQVDFMEEHDDYVCCCHRYRIYNENSGIWEQDYVSDLFEQYPDGFTFSNKDNFRTWITKTMTLLYRAEALMPDADQFRYWRDVHRCYYLLKQGKGYCFPFDGAVYRRQDMGIFSSLDDYNKQLISYRIMWELYQANKDDDDLREHFTELHNLTLDIIRNKIQYRQTKGICEQWSDYIDVDYHLNGIKGVCYSIRKMLLSYSYRFRK